MSDHKWDPDGTPVILLPADDRGDGLFELASSWTSHWLLSPAIWVKVADIKADKGEVFIKGEKPKSPPTIRAFVTGRNGFKEVELFQELGRNELELLRLITCRSIETNQAYHELQDKVVDVIHHYVKISAPLHEPSENHKVGTEVKTTNLIFAPTDQSGGSQENLFEFEWDLNILVSPEDRPTSAGFDSFTRYSNEDQLNGFILANIATAAGIWSGVNKTVSELSEFDTSSAFDKILVQRTFVRGVLTEGVAIRFAADALKYIEDHGNPLDDPLFSIKGIEKLTESEVYTQVKQAVELALKEDNSALSFNLTSPPSEKDSPSIGFFKTVWLFVKFSLNKLLAFPGWLLEDFISVFNRKATKLFYGEEGVAKIDLNVDFKKVGLTKDTYRLTQEVIVNKESLLKKLQTIDNLPDYRNTHPNLWSGIRKDLLSYLDGSNSQNKDKVISNPQVIIPVLGNKWVMPDFLVDPDDDPEEIISELDWLNVDDALKIKSKIEESIREIDDEMLQIKTSQSEVENARDQSKKQLKKFKKEKDKNDEEAETIEMILTEVSNVN